MAGGMSIPYTNLYHCLCKAGWKDFGGHILLAERRLWAVGAAGEEAGGAVPMPVRVGSS